MKTQKPDAEVFAKKVLWQLAGIRSRVDYLVDCQIEHEAKIKGVSFQEASKAIDQKILKFRRKLYQEMRNLLAFHRTTTKAGRELTPKRIPCAASNPAIALSLQSWPLLGRVAELGR